MLLEILTKQLLNLKTVYQNLDGDSTTLDDSSRLARLQFIICQLENSTIPKNRRRYNVLSQVFGTEIPSYLS